MLTAVLVGLVLLVAGAAIAGAVVAFHYKARASSHTIVGASAGEMREAMERMRGRGILYPAPPQEKPQAYEGKVTLSHNYYNNPKSLRLLLAAYWAAPAAAKKDVVLQIVDDASPESPPGPVIEEFLATYGRENGPYEVRVVTIEQDVGFNVAGARNTGVEAAPTPVVFYSDIDQVVAPRKLGALLRARRELEASPALYYLTRADGSKTTSWMVHRDAYRAVGGNDEDFSGLYGNEENAFDEVAMRTSLAVVKPHPYVTLDAADVKAVQASDHCSSCASIGAKGRQRNLRLSLALWKKKRRLGPNRGTVSQVRLPWHVEAY